MERSRRGEPGLSNKEIRQITRFDQNQVTRLMRELRRDHDHVQSLGHGAGTVYDWLKGYLRMSIVVRNNEPF